MVRRENTRKVQIGNRTLGGSKYPLIQSMASIKTAKKEEVLAQLKRCYYLGADLMRLSIFDKEDAEAFSYLSKMAPLPLIADIHFDYRFALMALENGAAAIRINPGNIGGKDKVALVIQKAKEKHAAIRIGANSGSLPSSLAKEGEKVKAEALLSAIHPYVSFFEKEGFYDIVLSLKGSDVRETVEAYRLAANTYPYPLHLGITEAGPKDVSLLRSAAGLSPLLLEGIGDTIRISMTEEPEEEIKACCRLLHDLGLYPNYPTFISCPTCGRTMVDLLPLAKKVETYLEEQKIPLKVAVMGCVVNGPGEASHADFALCGAKNSWVLYQKDQIIGQYKEEEAYQALLLAIKKKLS